MSQPIGTYLHVLNRNELPDGTQLLHIKEIPPPYSSVGRQTNESRSDDWAEKLIELQPLHNDPNRYGFTLSGGIGTEYGPPIVISHIDSCSKLSTDNGRTNLRLFDRILTMNSIDLRHVTHEAAIQIFNTIRGQPIVLHIRRLEPIDIEFIDMNIPSDMSDLPLGITITGGLDEDAEDPGLFISQIHRHGLLAAITSNNQLRVGDRLLEIKTNYSSINLRWMALNKVAHLIQRTCQDNRQVTLVVAHQT